MSTDFFLSALEYYHQGFMTIPLTLDGTGFPKRPITPNWSQIPYSLEALKKLDWDSAMGLGILLGAASKNLAVLDLDDVDLAEAAVKWTAHTRTIRTIRGRCHIYVREATISKPRKFNALWKGKVVEIELKTQGQQVAAPPTPGYSFLSEAEPKCVANIGVAWAGLARVLGVEYTDTGENYPKPWQEKVSASGRNKSAYVEAHFLREAHVPLPLAQRLMQIRWQTDYEQGGQTWEEIARTIESAYDKGQHPPLTEVFRADVEWN